MSTSLTVSLDPVALREATTQAIMGVLTPEIRERLIRESISALLAPSTNSWDRGASPLQEAFNRAVTNVANQMAREWIEADETIKAKIRTLMTEAAQKMLSVDTDKLAERMADAFVHSLRSDR